MSALPRVGAEFRRTTGSRLHRRRIEDPHRRRHVATQRLETGPGFRGFGRHVGLLSVHGVRAPGGSPAGLEAGSRGMGDLAVGRGGRWRWVWIVGVWLTVGRNRTELHLIERRCESAYRFVRRIGLPALAELAQPRVTKPGCALQFPQAAVHRLEALAQGREIVDRGIHGPHRSIEILRRQAPQCLT